MTGPRLWDRDNPDHVEFFRVHVLAPLAGASKARDFAARPTDPREVRELAQRNALETARLWIVGLEDVPRETLLAGVRRLVGSVRWLPKPVEIREACAAAIADQRRRVAVAAAALRSTCAAGCDEGWLRTPGPDGVDVMKRCDCRVASDRLLAGRPALVALPAAPVEESEVA